MQMSAMASPVQSELPGASLPVATSVDGTAIRPADLKNDESSIEWPSPGKRVLVALTRFLITFCIGVAVTLAWQSYGDEAKEMVASSFPQLGWLAPQAAPVTQNAPEIVAQADRPSPDQQQLNAMSLDLDAMRQSVDRIITSQEQIIHRVDQLAAGQEQMTREIAKLQTVAQYLLYKNSDPPPLPRPLPTPPPKPVPRPPLAPPAPTVH
jgi:hypothetical protein